MPHQEDGWGSGATAPRVLNMDSWTVGFTPEPLYLREMHTQGGGDQYQQLQIKIRNDDYSVDRWEGGGGASIARA
jgi:hypothetical protein